MNPADVPQEWVDVFFRERASVAAGDLIPNLGDVARRMLAAVTPLIAAAEREACKWQPIATAPVDGQILIWDDETNMAEAYDGDGETPVSDMRPSADHWRPLPAGPKK